MDVALAFFIFTMSKTVNVVVTSRATADLVNLHTFHCPE